MVRGTAGLGSQVLPWSCPVGCALLARSGWYRLPSAPCTAPPHVTPTASLKHCRSALFPHRPAMSCTWPDPCVRLNDNTVERRRAEYVADYRSQGPLVVVLEDVARPRRRYDCGPGRRARDAAGLRLLHGEWPGRPRHHGG